jgi:hypothetical protein
VSPPVEDELGAFLARWSRRKAAARRGAAEPDPAAPGDAPAPPPVPPAGAPARPEGGEPAPAEARTGPDPMPLPDPDTLDAASDLRPFLEPGVPAELRRRALRRMWRINPIIATPDGLDDYYVVNDFSDASTAVAGLKTLYRVGRGMLAAAEEEAEPPARPEEARPAALAEAEPPRTEPLPEPSSTAPAEAVAARPAAADTDGLRRG